MGQQQLLLIILAIIIVGIAISVAIAIFRANAIDSKRDILIEETTSLGSMAVQYYKKPEAMGGGGHSFINFEVPPQMVNTINGNHLIAEVEKDQLVIVGTGSEVVTGNDSIKVETTVRGNGDIFTVIIN